MALCWGVECKVLSAPADAGQSNAFDNPPAVSLLPLQIKTDSNRLYSSRCQVAHACRWVAPRAPYERKHAHAALVRQLRHVETSLYSSRRRQTSIMEQLVEEHLPDVLGVLGRARRGHRVLASVSHSHQSAPSLPVWLACVLFTSPTPSPFLSVLSPTIVFPFPDTPCSHVTRATCMLLNPKSCLKDSKTPSPTCRLC